jgi:hypothetical protein
MFKEIELLKDILSLLIIFAAFTVLIHSNPVNDYHYYLNSTAKRPSFNNFIYSKVDQILMVDEGENHHLRHSVIKKSGIELVNYDDYSKIYSLLNYNTFKILVINRKTGNENNSGLICSLPGSTQIQKSVKSEFLLI